MVVLYSNLLWLWQSAPLLQSSTASCNLLLFWLSCIYLLFSASLFFYIYINLYPIYSLKVFIIYSIVYILIAVVVHKEIIYDVDVRQYK